MKNSIGKKTAYYGMLIALAFVFSYIEVLIPFSFGVPGIKLGLANIVVLTTLYTLGVKKAFVVSCIRIVLVGFTFSNLFTMLYSLAGGLLSFIVMSLLKRRKTLSTIGVSIAGGVSHNIGQILVAVIVLENISISYYLPFLMIAGIVTGLLIGILGNLILKVMPTIMRHE